MIRIAEYEPSHLEKLELRNEQATECPARVNSQAVTVLSGETPIAIFGGYFVMPGVYQAWGLVSHHVSESPIAFHKIMRTFVKFFIEENQIRRMQISVRCGYARAWRWAISLGFRNEGTMKNYGVDGTDHWLFARTT